MGPAQEGLQSVSALINEDGLRAFFNTMASNAEALCLNETGHPPARRGTLLAVSAALEAAVESDPLLGLLVAVGVVLGLVCSCAVGAHVHGNLHAHVHPRPFAPHLPAALGSMHASPPPSPAVARCRFLYHAKRLAVVEVRKEAKRVQREQLRAGGTALAFSPATGWLPFVAVPVLLSGNIALFLSGHLALGATIDLAITIAGVPCSLHRAPCAVLLAPCSLRRAPCAVLPAYPRAHASNVSSQLLASQGRC